jgi:hypothetical protein
MPDINVDTNYFDHPKTKRLIGQLGKGSDVLPLRLWAYCGKFHAKDGKLAEYSISEIESIIGWWGVEGKAFNVLLSLGWVEKNTEGHYQVTQWGEHQGHLSAYKLRASHASKTRWERLKPSNHATSKLPSIPLSNPLT